MNHCSTSAIVLRRFTYGDYDVIVTVLTADQGKRTLIAKAARKSAKRFAGILEPFANLHILFRDRSGKGMPVLEEASLIQPFGRIRNDMVKTAFASYWTELVTLWIEEKQARPEIFKLLLFALGELADGQMEAASLSVLFQMRFIGQEGFQPVLERCTCCQKELNHLVQDHFCIDLNKGGVVCRQCPTMQASGALQLAKGTLKQLLWIATGELAQARRIRFDKQALQEATRFLEAFVPYHIGRQPKSLSVLKQVRNG
jgi:DNA repair protein RecO (recombination protein O)